MAEEQQNNDTLSFLPVKFLYSRNRKAIQMFYRKRNDHRLFSKYVPYEHYIFTEVNGHEEKDEVLYRHLSNGRYYKKEFMDPSKAKKTWKEYPEQTAEGDVSPETRFVVDSYYNTDWPGDIKPRIFYFDIETEIVGAELPNFHNNKAEITAFTIYDNYTETYYLRALYPKTYQSDESDIDKILKELEEYNIKSDIKLFDTAKDLIADLIDFFVSMPPDIITSWNSVFDIPYTVRKVFDHFGEEGLKNLSPFNFISWKVKQALETGEPVETDLLIPGISSIDDLQLYKQNTDSEKVSYSLNSVAIAELDEGKVQYDTDFLSLYTENFIHFCKYNVQDVRIMVMLEKKMKLLDLAIGVRNLAKCNFESIFHQTQSIDTLCLMKINKWRAKGKNWVLPSKPTIVIKKDFIGAYVKPTIKGRFKWVGDLDYKSEYPSEYVTWGLSMENLVGMIDNFQEVVQKSFNNLFPELTTGEVYDNLMPNFGVFNKQGAVTVTPSEIYSDIPVRFETFEDFRDWCIKKNYAIMANGLIVDSNAEEPFIGSLAGEVMDLRDTYKVLMKKHDSAGDEIMALVYDILQKAVKTINNSIYGATAAGSFRLFDIRLAEAITSTGQAIIKSSTYILNRKMNRLIKQVNPDHEYRDVVITNDTDSIIFTVEDLVKTGIDCDDVEKFKKIVEVVNLGQKEVNSEIKNVCKEVFFVSDVESSKFRMFIKNEWLASSGIFLAKKGYALNIVFKEGYPKKTFKVAGLSLKKVSTPKAMQEFLAEVVKKILNFDPQSSIDSFVMAEAIKLKTYPVEDISCPSGVNGIDSYTKTIPIHVRGAKVFNQYFAESKKDYINTDKVKYILVKKWLTEQKLNFDKEYVLSIPTNKKKYWDKLSEWIIPDYDKLRTKLIIKPIEKIYEAMKWQIPNISRADIKSSFSKFKKSKKEK